MSEPIRWDWSDPKGQRKLKTVEDYIFWSYAVLSITRQIMEDRRTGKLDRFSGARAKWANIEMKKYQEQKRNISTLDRDDALAQDGIKVCAHCGTTVPNYQWDHLIPQSRLVGEYVALNQIRSCPHCNTSRGNMELMHWHRQRLTFPTLGILRRYLKLCYFYSKQRECLGKPAGEAVQDGLPFDPRNLPRKFPMVDHLIWDYAHPDA
ncbi:hypothetical protein AX761_24645 [Rhizobium sp. 58]|nr:hypothetical protein AX761_24645 [Rhizobium sp. 58]